MGSRVTNQSLFEDFLMQLEYLALNAEDKITTLESTNADYKYVRDLLEVLRKSKLAFAEGYCNLSKEKEKEFKNIITRRIVYPELLTRVLKESKNLFYLKKSELYQRIEVKSQRQASEQILEEFIKKLTEFIDRVDYQKNENEIKSLKEYIENIIFLANDFEEYGSVRDIDFFQEVIEEIDLSDSEKKEIISLALLNNLEMYKKKFPDKEKIEKYSPEQIKPETKEEEPTEQIEELLEEMLSESELEKKVKLK